VKMMSKKLTKDKTNNDEEKCANKKCRVYMLYINDALYCR